MLDLTQFDVIFSSAVPFGDGAYIQGQMRSAFKRRLKDIGAVLPVALDLLHSLSQADPQIEYRVLGDPVVRAAIQQALGSVVTTDPMVLSLEQCEEILGETVRHIETGAVRCPLESGTSDRYSLGSESHTPFIYDGGPCNTVFERTFRQLVESEYGESLCTPTPEDIEILQKATRLLDELSPLLSRSALSHVHLIGIFPGKGKWEKVASSSQFRLTGAFFLNRTTFKNPWWLAEHILHESLHQKLYDFRHAHSLLARDDPRQADLPAEAQRVISLWNTPGLSASNSWDPHRSFAAFHVYVHLAYFCALAEERAPGLERAYGRLNVPPSMTDSSKAFARARYLGEKLQSACWPELGLAGQKMVDWLFSILNAIDPIPAPVGPTFTSLWTATLWKRPRFSRSFLQPRWKSS